jgi:hypothetical protein
MTEYYCAVDIESLGHANSSIPFSIGFCHGSNWENRKKVRISIQPDAYHKFHPKYGTELKVADYSDLSSYITDVCEPCTWSEFWSKNTDILSDLLSEAIPAKEGFSAVSDIIKEIYTNKSVSFLGDNPSFDFSHMSYALEKYCDELPMRFSNRKTFTELRNSSDPLPSDGYHGIKDPSERIKYHPRKSDINAVVKAMSNHSHKPDDDAEGIYLQYLLLKDDKFLTECSDL